MSSRRKNRVCVLFEKDCKPYRKGTYSWVSTSTFDEVKGCGKEYDPVKGKVVGEEKPKSKKVEKVESPKED